MSLLVSSELYSEQKLVQNDCANKKYLSVSYTIPEDSTSNVSQTDCITDEDGDLIVCRRPCSGTIHLDVEEESYLAGVGRQLWRGSLLLADLLLDRRTSLSGASVVELGTGVGLTSIVAAMFAHRVIPTDLNRCGILESVKRNFTINTTLVKSEVNILPLDFMDKEWSAELKKELEQADIILAADVIYDNEITEAFSDTLANILKLSSKTAWIALEKRYVFTVQDLDTCAPCYEHFLEYLKISWNKPPMSNWTIKQLDTSFPKYFDYERNRHLVLWEIKS